MVALLFIAAVAATTLLWNRHFERVPWRAVAVMVAFVALHQGKTLVTPKVNLPGNLAYVAYPWKALEYPTVNANTGIIFTQIAPWTASARRSIAAGAIPLWNRHSAAGTPLFANQQTSLLHPISLLALLVPTAQAFSLSAALRLFAALFFLFVFLRNWSVHPYAALFGAVAYGFSTFSVVWLLFPLGLATLGVVPGLALVDEFLRRPTRAAFIWLVIAFALPILGGHPESALWVGLTLAAYGTWGLWNIVALERRLALAAGATAAALLALALTAIWWLPTLEALPHTSRYSIMKTVGHPPVDLPQAWMTTLLAPNLLGTPQSKTYEPPTPRFPTLLDDYGEIASGYAGLITLALALSVFGRRHAATRFFSATALFAFLTLSQAPLFYPLLRRLPVIDLTLDQRLRFLWALSLSILAAFALDELAKGAISRRRVALACAVVMAGSIAIYAGAPKPWPIAATVAAGTGIASLLALRCAGSQKIALLLTALTFIELTVVTWRYNPAADPRDVYPVTGAIETMQRGNGPYRIAALGWSLLPETPNWYGLEDVKTTDPMSNPRYLRLLLGYLHIDGADYDQVIGTTTEGFFDFLNVRYLYVPPGHPLPTDPALAMIYRGADGLVFSNRELLPRYFFVKDFVYEPSFDGAVARMKEIRDFRQTAIADSIPGVFGAAEAGARFATAGATATLVRYGPNSADLQIRSIGWNLLVTSDVEWPGWRATFNGRSLPIARVNGAFIGTFVPHGEGVLRLEYRPRGFVIGSVVSAIAACALLVLMALNVSRNRKSKATS